MKVTINLGKGTLNNGCDNVIVQLLDRNHSCLRQVSGSLPPAPELATLHRQWQSNYRAFYQQQGLRIGLLESEGFRYSNQKFQQICHLITLQLNQWLNSEGFTTIERVLRTDLATQEPIQIIIAAQDRQIQQLPWHLWQFLEDYHWAETAVSSLNWKKINLIDRQRPQVRILTILGNSDGIDVRADLKALAALPETELTILTEPKLSELNDYLWQHQGWDILLFSGHSHSSLDAGYIYLNAEESITIAQLKHSLNKAIANGLQIAIFNSCQGVGLAFQLGDLSLPYTVVMGEPVPDRIAQLFLNYFLTAFAGGKTFTLAVKEARQKLAGWETEFICASWLPVIWQNPTMKCLSWQDLQSQSRPQPQQRKKLWQSALLGSLLVSSSVMVGRWLGWLEPVELWAYDRTLQQRPAESIDPRILVVEIDETDTNRDRYPLSDETLVRAIDILESSQPVAVGLDLHRPYSRDSGYQDLIQRLEANPHLFPVCAYGSENKSYAPPAGLSQQKLTQQMGFSDLLIDGGQFQAQNNFLLQFNPSPKVRRQLLSYDPSLATSPSSCLTPYSLSFQLAFEYLQQAGVKPLQVNEQQQWQFGKVVFREMKRKFGGYQQLDERSSQIPINYRAGQPGQKITLRELLSGSILPHLIRGRIVLIGYTASVARDYFNTPYGKMSGVWIHAHMTSQILSAVQDGRSLIWVLPQWGDWLWVVAWSMTTASVLVLLAEKSWFYSLLAIVILIFVIDGLCLLFLIKGGWLPYIAAIISLLLTTTVVVIGRMTISKGLNHNIQIKPASSL